MVICLQSLGRHRRLSLFGSFIAPKSIIYFSFSPSPLSLCLPRDFKYKSAVIASVARPARPLRKKSRGGNPWGNHRTSCANANPSKRAGPSSAPPVSLSLTAIRPPDLIKRCEVKQTCAVACSGDSGSRRGRCRDGEKAREANNRQRRD